jgi:hypothetical protein
LLAAVAAVQAVVSPAFGGVLGQVDFPLHVSADGRRLEDSLGRPFLVHGDTAWSLMVELTDAEVLTYLDDRQQRGFNTIVVNLIERGFGGPANQAGQQPFVPTNEYDSPNEAYFAHADFVIDQAALRGMLLLLTPSYLGSGCGAQGWCDQMLDEPVADMTTYGHFLGDRYAAKTNIIWVNGGDADAGEFSGALTRVNAIANAIRERAPSHLQTAHCSRFHSAIECYDQPWLDLNTTYSDCGESLNEIQADYARTPVQPFFFLEGKYENEDSTPLGCLMDQAIWAVLGGGTGQMFGNNPIWLFDPGWPTALNSVGSRAVSHIGRLFRSRAWFAFQPDLTQSVLVTGNGNGAVAARTADGESLVIYLPTARLFSVDLNQLSGSQAHAWWFNPQTGSTADIGLFTSNKVQNFIAASRQILVLDDAASHLPAPGSQPYPFGAEVPSVSGAQRGLLAALLPFAAGLAAGWRRAASRRS